MLHNFHFIHGISRANANTSEPSKSVKQTLMANSTAFACSEGAQTDTSLSRDTAKGVACKTRSEPR